MLQSPVLGYSAFSHLLQRQTTPMTSPPGLAGLGRPPAGVPASPGPGQQTLQGRSGGGGLGGGLPLPPGMPQFLASSLLQHLQHPQLPPLPQLAGCPSPPSPGSMSSLSPSPSSSPPTSLGGLGLPGGHGVKSFTIDAILGLSGPQHQQQAPWHRPLPHYPVAEPPSSPTDLSLGTNARSPQQQQQQQQHSPRRPSTGADGGLASSKKASPGGHGGLGGGKCKRVRTIFTAEQLERLEAEFERQQYMVGPERLYLAHALNLTEAQVKVWFQNRRIKWRKQHLELEQQRLAAIKQHHLPPPQPPPQHQHPLMQQQHHPDEDCDAASSLPHHRDLDSGSDDSAMSEDRAYFASFVVPNGMPAMPPHSVTPEPGEDADGGCRSAEPDMSPAASRARLVDALLGPGAPLGETCSRSPPPQQDLRDPRDPRDLRDLRDLRDPRDLRDLRDLQDPSAGGSNQVPPT